MEEFVSKAYVFIISLPFVIAAWVTKRIVANDKRITILEELVKKMDREFEVRDQRRVEDREILKELKDDMKKLMEEKR